MRRRTGRRDMIDLYCTGGAYLGVMVKYETMVQLMRDDFIRDQDFIEFRFEDGTKGAVRKGQINGFAESAENVEL